MTGNLTIREYEQCDRKAVEACFNVLQELEHSLEIDRVQQDIGSPYVDYLLNKCVCHEGKIFVAELDNTIVGFSCMWIEEEADSLITNLKRFAYFSDLVVLPKYRRKGVGSALVQAREQYAKSKGLSHVLVNVLWRNQDMRAFITTKGFREYELTYLKEL